MKKLLMMAVIAAGLVACNNSAESTDNTKDSLDSIANAKKEAIDSTAEQRKENIDSLTELKKDQLAPDSANNDN
ncbi:MAG TPA: hypothetical protein VGC29_00955 [Flavisolibacter sp.]